MVSSFWSAVAFLLLACLLLIICWAPLPGLLLGCWASLASSAMTSSPRSSESELPTRVIVAQMLVFFHVFFSTFTPFYSVLLPPPPCPNLNVLYNIWCPDCTTPTYLHGCLAWLYFLSCLLSEYIWIKFHPMFPCTCTFWFTSNRSWLMEYQFDNI